MNCPDCGSAGAECVIGNYWKCVDWNCKNFYRGPQLKAKEVTFTVTCTGCDKVWKNVRADHANKVAGGVCGVCYTGLYKAEMEP